MHLTPDEIRELLSVAGFPRSITDLLVARLSSEITTDTVVLIVDATLWDAGLKAGRTAFSLSTTAARSMRDQLNTALQEIDLQPPV